MGLAQASPDGQARAQALEHSQYGNIPLYAGRLAAVGGLTLIFIGGNSTAAGFGAAASLASAPTPSSSSPR